MASRNPCGMPAIDRLTEELGALPFVRAVLLFGSRARGSAGRSSDIDLAVDAPGVNAVEWQRVLDAVESAETLVPIDVVRLDQAGAALRERIEREGKISMSDELDRKLEQLVHVVERLREALAEPESAPLAIDGTIQRFEFTFELIWKVLKLLLAHEGIEAATPRRAISEAFRIGVITDEPTWLAMLQTRNLTSHSYDESLALVVYRSVREYLPEIDRTVEAIRARRAE